MERTGIFRKYRMEIIALAGVLLLLGIDQYTKHLAALYLKNKPNFVVIPGVFELSYLQNEGMAWGLFHGMQWMFLAAAVLAVGIICIAWVLVPRSRRYHAFRVLCVCFVAGVLGNALDRFARGFVIDFLYFSLIDFPVFNVADCLVCVSILLIVILYRNEDFSWINKKS